jgi:hypothetical protein
MEGRKGKKMSRAEGFTFPFPRQLAVPVSDIRCSMRLRAPASYSFLRNESFWKPALLSRVSGTLRGK